MSVEFIRLLGIREPVPEGWRVLGKVPRGNHRRYATVFIGKVGAKISKTERARGRQSVIEAMPRGRWLTTTQIAEIVRRPVGAIKTLVYRGHETGALEKRAVAGLRGRYEFRRVV